MEQETPSSHDRKEEFQLPLHLIHEIALILQRKKALATLASLSATNVQINVLANPILYSHLVLWQSRQNDSSSPALSFRDTYLGYLDAVFATAEVAKKTGHQYQSLIRSEPYASPILPTWQRMIENFKWVETIEFNCLDLSIPVTGIHRIARDMKSLNQTLLPNFRNTILTFQSSQSHLEDFPTRLAPDGTLVDFLTAFCSPKRLCVGPNFSIPRPFGYRMNCRGVIRRLHHNNSNLDSIYTHEDTDALDLAGVRNASVNLAIGHSKESEMIAVVIAAMMGGEGELYPTLRIQVESATSDGIKEKLKEWCPRAYPKFLKNLSIEKRDDEWVCDICSELMWNKRE